MVNFPGSLDSLANPTATTNRDDPGFSLSSQISNLNDIAEALESKVGITDSPASDSPLANKVLASLANGKSGWTSVIAAMIADGAAMKKIGETVLGADASSITFSSIPGTWRHLELVLYLRLAAAVSSGIVYCRFNGDSGANYDYQALTASNTTVVAAQTFADAATKFADAPGASAGANLFGVARIVIPHYANAANNKAYSAEYGFKTGTSAGNMTAGKIAGQWRSNAAITSLQILSGSGGNILTGSAASLYGLPL